MRIIPWTAILMTLAASAVAASVDTLKSYLRETNAASAQFTQVVYDRSMRKLQETSGTMHFSRPGRPQRTRQPNPFRSRQSPLM